MTEPDLEAIADALADDLHGGFPRYVRATIDGVYSGALRMLGDHHDAEDVVQETYARAIHALEGYSAARIRDLRVAGWTWTIAANVCRNRLRSRARKPTTRLVEDQTTATDSDAADVALEGVDGALQHALLQLPFPQRAAVVMRHVIDQPYEAIASALDRPVGTVKADVHRGLAKLRTVLTPEVMP